MALQHQNWNVFTLVITYQQQAIQLSILATATKLQKNVNFDSEIILSA